MTAPRSSSIICSASFPLRMRKCACRIVCWDEMLLPVSEGDNVHMTPAEQAHLFLSAGSFQPPQTDLGGGSPLRCLWSKLRNQLRSVYFVSWVDFWPLMKIKAVVAKWGVSLARQHVMAKEKQTNKNRTQLLSVGQPFLYVVPFCCQSQREQRTKTKGPSPLFHTWINSFGAPLIR